MAREPAGWRHRGRCRVDALGIHSASPPRHVSVYGRGQRAWCRTRPLDVARTVPASPSCALRRTHLPEWSHVYTTQLLELLNVLCFCVELEPQQATLLDHVLRRSDDHGVRPRECESIAGTSSAKVARCRVARTCLLTFELIRARQPGRMATVSERPGDLADVSSGRSVGVLNPGIRCSERLTRRPDRSSGADEDQSAAVTSLRIAVRSWPLLVLAVPAAAEVWSGWVGIVKLTGFGMVSPLPGIWPSLHLDT